MRWLAVLPVGLLTGLVGWLMVGGSSTKTDQLTALEQSLTLPTRHGDVLKQMYTRELTTRPLFPLLNTTGDAREPILQIIGVSVTRKRQAALIAIDGEPAAWMAPGERQGGVALLEINGTQVLIETPLGPKAMQVGERSDEGSAPLAGGSQTVVDQMPPGFRAPPPPADGPEV